jgi:hypothetical protein
MTAPTTGMGTGMMGGPSMMPAGMSMMMRLMGPNRCR